MKKETKPKEKLIEIKKKRSQFGYFTHYDMADMFEKHGIYMSRPTYSNKESGKSNFTVEEIKILSEVMQMDLADTIHLFNDWD